MTGPDHLLSLGPAALERPRAPWRIGLVWGLGHAVGTLLLGIPALWLAHALHLPGIAAWGDRVAGLALLAMAAWSAWKLRAHRSAASASASAARSPLLVGLVHGVSGAASLLMVLPVLATGSLHATLVFLVAFGAGSTLAMAALTSALALAGGRLGQRLVARLQVVLLAAACALGLFWLVF